MSMQLTEVGISANQWSQLETLKVPLHTVTTIFSLWGATHKHHSLDGQSAKPHLQCSKMSAPIIFSRRTTSYIDSLTFIRDIPPTEKTIMKLFEKLLGLV